MVSVVEVKTQEQRKLFVSFPTQFYKNVPQYIPNTYGDDLEDWDACIAAADANLAVEGRGHSVCIHSNDTDHIEAAAQRLPVSRFLINQICSTNNGGSFFNSLSATTTLGCGSWGNNSISENLSYFHLFNKSRIAFKKKNWSQPSEEEIWG